MSLAARVAELAGSPVARVQPIGAGSAGFRVELADGRALFAKTAGYPARVEGAGLAWLADGGAEVPDLIGVRDDLLVLAWIDALPPSPAAAQSLGRRLAALHLSGAPTFGAPPPGVSGGGSIGAAPMSYADCPDWPTFFAEHRIRPYLGAARASGNVDSRQYDAIARVCDRIDRLAGPPVRPARLHGDLWAGNLLWQASTAALIDPAAHGGHPESDLAMLALFPPPLLPDILRGYESVAPLAPGWRARVPLHQLYPLLVHARLFGGGYGAMAAAAAARLPVR